MDKVIEIGEFTLDSKVIITDPCYDLGDSATYIINNAKPGNWLAYARINDDGRVVSLIAVHKDFPMEEVSSESFKLVWKDLGVDSGQLAICNLADYHHDDNEYDKYCHATDNYAGIVGEYANPANPLDYAISRAYAVVTQTGYGDGTYQVRTISDGRATSSMTYAINLKFL